MGGRGTLSSAEVQFPPRSFNQTPSTGTPAGEIPCVLISAQLLSQVAVPSAVGEVNDKTNRQPDAQPSPILNTEREHKDEAAHDPSDRDKRHERCPERSVRTGVQPSHDQYGGTHHQECQKRADIHHIRENVEREQRCRGPDQHARKDGRLPRRAKAGMDRAEKALRQQPIARDGEQDPRLTEHHDQEHACDASDSPGGNEQRSEIKASLRKSVRNWGINVDFVVGNHAGQDAAHQNIENSADQQRGDYTRRHIPLRVLGFLGVRGNRIEANIGKENSGRSGKHARGLATDGTTGQKGNRKAAVTVWCEIVCPVGRVDQEGAHTDYEEHDGNFKNHHRRIEPCAFSNADN